MMHGAGEIGLLLAGVRAGCATPGTEMDVPGQQQHSLVFVYRYHQPLLQLTPCVLPACVFLKATVRTSM